MRTEEFTDAQWAYLAPLLSPRRRGGRPRADDRQTLNGILWVLRSGARWKDLPRRYGSPSTCHRRLQAWQRQRVGDHLWLAILATLDAREKLDQSRPFLHGSFVPEKKGTGCGPSTRLRPGKGRAAPCTP